MDAVDSGVATPGRPTRYPGVVSDPGRSPAHHDADPVQVLDLGERFDLA
jgi:hypothetical protein